MKKLIVLTYLLVASFLMFACDFACDEEQSSKPNFLIERNEKMENLIKNLKKEWEKQLRDIRETAKDNHSQTLVLSEVGKYLRTKGCSDNEIIEMQKIETEDFGSTIDHVVFFSYHFYYKNHDNGQTYANCGLYAMKRLLFVLGKHDIVNKDLWYRYTDSELREMIVEISGDTIYRNQNKLLWAHHLATLMRRLGIDDSYGGVYSQSDWRLA